MRYRTGDQLLHNKIYIGTLLPCQRCNVLVAEYYFVQPEVTTEEVLCKVCKLELVPPRLELKEYSGHLWNITQNKFEENFTIKEFSLCGWFLREQTEEIPTARLPRRDKTATYTLEHYGKVKCIRLPDYPFYYDDMSECVTSKCRDIHIP